MRRRHGRLALAVTAVSWALLAACSAQEPTGPGPQVDPTFVPGTLALKGLDDRGQAAWSQWQDLAVDNYRYRLQVSCFCLTVDGTVVVDDAEVVSVDGRPYHGRPPTGFGESDPTIEGVFEVLAKALRSADQVDVRYDAETGVPARIDIDWITNAIDDEIGYRITALRYESER